MKGPATRAHRRSHGAGHAEVLRLLLANGAGAMLNEPCAAGWSPLHFAAERGHPAAVAVLSEAGAVSSATANGSLRPEEMAATDDVRSELALGDLCASLQGGAFSLRGGGQ